MEDIAAQCGGSGEVNFGWIKEGAEECRGAVGITYR